MTDRQFFEINRDKLDRYIHSDKRLFHQVFDDLVRAGVITVVEGFIDPNQLDRDDLRDIMNSAGVSRATLFWILDELRAATKIGVVDDESPPIHDKPRPVTANPTKEIRW